MKLATPNRVVIGAIGVVLLCVFVLAVNLKSRRRSPVPAQVDADSHRAHLGPAVAPARAHSGAAASSGSVESEPAVLTPLQRAQRQAADRQHHLAALFYDPDAPDSPTARSRVAKAINAKYKDRMEVFEVPVTEAAHQATVQRLAIFKTPLVLMFAPSGAITHHFREFDDVNAELAKAVLSPKTEEVLAGLQERKVVFIHVRQSQGGPMYEGNRAELAGLADILSTSVHVVHVRADAPKEQHLLREVVKLDPAKEAPVTVVVAKSGAVVEKIPGKLSRELLLNAFRKVLVYRSGCGGSGSGPGGGTCQ
ncbi:hypothetical protein LCGC14_2189970 [marine sediment metagenome]|uniref:Thioredoxin domain-containing protein n=1 Tax=marine sediment metagenome TaxID=412755 RepID=A0A0F9DK12_9ZZZZ